MTLGEIQGRLKAEFPDTHVFISVTVGNRTEPEIDIHCVQPKEYVNRCRSIKDAISKMRDRLEAIDVRKVDIQA